MPLCQTRTRPEHQGNSHAYAHAQLAAAIVRVPPGLLNHWAGAMAAEAAGDATAGGAGDNFCRMAEALIELGKFE